MEAGPRNFVQGTEILIEEKHLYKRYKNQKLQISSKFMKTIFKILTILPLFSIFLSIFIDLLSPIEIIVGLCAFVFCLLLQVIREDTMLAYILRLLFFTIIEFRSFHLGVAKHPQCISIFVAISYFFVWHGHLDLIYNKIQGYATIIIHTSLWGYYIASLDINQSKTS